MSSPSSEQPSAFPGPIAAIPQRDLLALEVGEQDAELAAFSARLRDWAERLASVGDGGPDTVSVEIPVFKGGWVIPCVESVLYQTSTRWNLSLRWDGGDDLSRRILETLERLHHPKIHVYFGENFGIAYNRRFLTERSHGTYILPVDDDDMLAPAAVETFLTAARERPWSGIIRAKRDFIDEVGRPVESDPWFPFEPRHYQFGMVQDVFNHSQPTLIRRSAYDRTSGWEGFEEFRFAGEDCDLYLKLEEVAPIELLDEVLYLYRISDRRTSLAITDNAAFEMWRRLADKSIARIGLSLKRTNEKPPFAYERLPRPRLTVDAMDFVIVGGSAQETLVRSTADRTVRSLSALGINPDAIHSVIGGGAARNEGFARTTRPLVCYLNDGLEIPESDTFGRLLAAMEEREADMVGPTIRSAEHRDKPAHSGAPADASWLPSTLLIVRREVVKAVGGFEPDRGDAIADRDFWLKARRRNFTGVRAAVTVVDHAASPTDAGSAEDAEWLRAKWELQGGLLKSVDQEAADCKALYEQGNERARDGRVEDAVRAFRRVTRLHSNFSWGYHSLGDALFQAERWEEAVTAYRRAIDLKPDVSWSHHHLGNSLSKLERWREASEAYRRAIIIEPDVASAHRNLGLAMLRVGDFSGAAAAFDEAVRLDAHDFWSHYSRGDALSGLQRWEDAIDAYRRAIALRSDVPWSHTNLGNALVRLERREEAVAAFRRAIELQPDLASNELGQALLQLKRWDEALSAFDDALRLGAEPFWPHYGRGDALSGLQRWDEAVDAYGQAIARRSDILGPFLNLGAALIRQERWAAAATTFRQAIEIQPDSVTARVNLCNVLSKQERWEETVEACSGAIALNDRSFWAHQFKGLALLRLRRWDEAAATFRQAVDIDPGFAWSHHYLGDALLQLDRFEEAARAYRRAIGLEPELFWSHNNLGQALLKLGRLDQAADALRGAIAARPDLSVAHHNLGDALVRSGRWDEAAAAYQRADEINPAWSRRDVGPPVSGVERWLDRLLSAPGGPTVEPETHKPRVLFVLDNDYGELTTAMYLLLGQDLAQRTWLLLPPRLHVNNRNCLPGRTRPSRSLRDVVDAVDEYEPAIVVLASGYLFPIHEIFSPEALRELVDVLTARGCRVVTTDPFLGLLSNLGTSTRISIDIPENAPAQLVAVKCEQDQRLIENFSRAVQVLGGLPHLYPVFPAAPGESPGGCEVDAISFFNPKLLLAGREAVDAGDADDGRAAAKSATAPQWVFVLASRDYEVQVIFHGKDWFINQLADRLEETWRAGRHPVFIGPYDCVQALIERMSGGDAAVGQGLTLLTFCPFRRFSALLINAEYVFYWNALSHSMFLRLFNQLPVFLFDRGHLVRNVVPLYERIVGWYYQGWTPVYLDPEQELDLATLAPLADAYGTGAHEVARHVRRSPVPDEMIEQLLTGHSRRPATGPPVAHTLLSGQSS